MFFCMSIISFHSNTLEHRIIFADLYSTHRDTVPVLPFHFIPNRVELSKIISTRKSTRQPLFKGKDNMSITFFINMFFASKAHNSKVVNKGLIQIFRKLVATMNLVIMLKVN